MDQENNLDLNQTNEENIGSNQQNSEMASQSFEYSKSQLQWMNSQVYNLERELLLNNNYNVASTCYMSNWTKVILSALAVIIPGIGQIIGIIMGLVFVSDDINADKRSYGAALLTVSIVAFIILSVFWFIFALAFGPQLYY